MENKQPNEPTKAEVLEKILKDDTRGFRILPAPGYGHKMQTIRKASLDMLPILPVTRAVGQWVGK